VAWNPESGSGLNMTSFRKAMLYQSLRNISWTSLTLGIVMAALSVGFVIEFGRSEQMRTGAFVEASVVALISYFTPALWLRWRYGNEFNLVWLAIPILGSALVYLAVVLFPNEISMWNQSGGRTFITDAVDVFPTQLLYFFLAVFLLSGISCLIIGLTHGLDRLFRFLLNNKSSGEAN
jgi:hypothetical protein